MTTRDNTEIKLRVYGYLEKTPHCKGPQISTDRGLDSPCCAKCHNLRLIYYRGNGRLINNNKTSEYLEYLRTKNIDNLDTVYALSTCGFYPTLCFMYGKTELYTDTFYSILLDQFMYLHEHKIILSEINAKTFAYTKNGIPIILPAKFTTVDNYGGDEGVKIINHGNDKYIREVDRSERKKSHKWSFLFHFYDALNFFEPTSGVYHENYKCYYQEELFLKIPSICKNEGI